MPAEGNVNWLQGWPWWTRVSLLVLVGAPIFGASPLHHGLHADHLYNDLLAWLAYSALVWMFVGLAVGIERLVNWLAIAAVFAITVVLTGALLRATNAWDAISRMVGQPSSDPSQSMADLLFRFISMMAAYPFMMLSLYIIPASTLAMRISGHASTRGGRMLLPLAAALRGFQAVAEQLGLLLQAWREENPSIYYPRHRAEMRGMAGGITEWCAWARENLVVWILALASRSLLIVPTITRDQEARG